MATTAIVCTDCEAAVPYGRLSCPSCGNLLAAVVGGTPRATVVVEPEAFEPEPEEALEHEPHPEPLDQSVDQAPQWPPPLDDEADADPRMTLSWPDPEPPPAAAVASPDPEPERWGPVVAETPDPPLGSYVPPTAGGLPSLAPSAVMTARAWGPVPAAVGAGIVQHPGTATSADPSAPSSVAGWAKLDPARAVEIAGWLAIAGSALGLAGLVLPWSIGVIGAGAAGTYFGSWGMGGPWHVLVGLLCLVVLAGAVIRNPVPAWLRTGLAGLVAGALLLGLAWPYMFGPLGAKIGIPVTVVGAVLLLAAGTIAVVVRHVEAEPPV